MSIKSFLSLTALRTFAHLPLGITWRVAAVAGLLAYWLPTREKKVSQKNIRHALPELSVRAQNALVKNSLQESAKSFMESPALWRMDAQHIQQLLQVHGTEHLDNAKGVILAAPHLASWEIIGLWVSSQHPLSCLYRHAKLAAIDAYIIAGRSRFGAQLAPNTIKGVMTLKKALDKQEYISILPDQDPTDSGGVFVDFFGQPAFSSTLAPKLAQKTGAKIVLTHTIRKPGGFDLYFSEPDPLVYDADVAVATAALSRDLEAIIRQKPEQYMWSGKRYRTQESGPNFYTHT